MLGTLVGDIYGSHYEKSRTPVRTLPELTAAHSFTDDTVITLAVAQHLLTGTPLKEAFRTWVAHYPQAGYGKLFAAWALGSSSEELVSWGNGALMRLGPVAALATSLQDARHVAADITRSTHGHPSAMQAADIYGQLHWAALHGASNAELLASWNAGGGSLHAGEANHQAGSPMRVRADDTLEDVMSCLAESDDFDSLLAACLYHGGDSDTIAATACVLGEALWGVPQTRAAAIAPFLDDRVRAAMEQLDGAIDRLNHT
ncbi:ADP-ribosylglycohydrolase family protein [Massilia pseudoviolaceinigra]|uniref:ADP-ribosylglycohydrolase family protein n=1 Tax=Massilia pseudoviolaceinigra TaxID=3057165 RepID=UPI002796B795|nr:ADP-ribosylglycohydrolase family protein [Massilia sp. CCM 9206]MDQ1918706.1 ADP-ribosylglycohydrolase family protein [Massilia sp. CCM 9206]